MNKPVKQKPVKKIFSKKNNTLNLKKVKEGVDDENLDPSFGDDMDADTREDGNMDIEGDLDGDSGDDLDDDEMVADDEMGDDLDGDEAASGDPKDLLMQVIMAIIDRDEEAASTALHQYMTTKSSDMVNSDGDDDLGDDDLGDDDLGDDDLGDDDLGDDDLGDDDLGDDDLGDDDLGDDDLGDDDLGDDDLGDPSSVVKPEDEEMCMGCKCSRGQCQC